MVAENRTPAESATQNQSVDAFDNSHASETPPDPVLLARVHRLFAELERMYYVDVESEIIRPTSSIASSPISGPPIQNFVNPAIPISIQTCYSNNT